MSGRIGAMRARVTLESPLRVADELGGAAMFWRDEGDVWAEIVAGAAGESAAFDTSPSTASYAVTIYPRTGVRAGWRILWGQLRLRIEGVADDGGPRIALSCTEEIL